ncbi:MAG: nucleoside recognition domain-containing protein [Syntrophobacteraceae bacterium]
MALPAADFTKQLFSEAFEISWRLFKIMIPVIVVVKVLQETGGIDFLGNLLSPVMRVVGLPGSMGLVWATTILTNLYAGVIVYSSLAGAEPITVAQITVLGLMMLVAHNLPIELRITQKAGVRLRFMIVLRFGCAFLFGWVLFRIYRWGDWLQGPHETIWIPPVKDSSLPAWALGQVRDLVFIFFVILALLLLMKILERIGITRIMVRLLNPILRLLGIGPSATTITIVGMTLGIAYGGGLIIQEAVSGRTDRRDVLFCLSLMGLCHSVIEDTLLIAIFGGHVSGILWGRIILSLIVVFSLVKLVSHMSERTLDRIFVRPPSS